MSIFSDAVLKAISDYRQILRRLLDQADRVRKLNQLGLREGVDPTDDLALYEMAYRIVKDIKSNLSDHNRGYYAYSGVRNFGEFLSEFLQQYSIYRGKIVHRAQHVARAMLLSIQLVGLPEEQLTQDIAEQLLECADTIYQYGLPEQCANYMKALTVARPLAPDFYEPLLEQVRSQYEKPSVQEEAVVVPEQAEPIQVNA